MIYAIICLIIIIGFLGFKLFQKQRLDTQERDKLENNVRDLRNLCQYAEEDLKNAKEKREYEEHKLSECRKDLQAALEVYQDITDNKLKEIDISIETQRKKRQADLDAQFAERQKNLEMQMKELTDATKKRVSDAEIEADEYLNELKAHKEDALQSTTEQINKFNSIVEVLRKYDLDRQEKYFYTIQLPVEYQDDINFLLTTVAQKVMHPDIISKLVWAEYVKPNLDDTFKRIEIKAEPGIYKLTSLQNGKCYVGKSTNVKNRIADHFKSSIGIKSIADQAVHHAILKEGFWNWTIEVVTYCDKDKLNDLEKYYIETFKAQDFGYNKTAGG